MTTDRPGPVTHLPAPTNPGLRLHQEFSMRTGGYDELARVESKRYGHTLPNGEPVRFHALVEELGTEDAIRDVETCCWLSESDWRRDFPGGPCVECQEVAFA